MSHERVAGRRASTDPRIVVAGAGGRRATAVVALGGTSGRPAGQLISGSGLEDE